MKASCPDRHGRLGVSLSVGSGARAKSEPFCTLQACMGDSRGQRATDVIVVGKHASACGYGGDCTCSIRDSSARMLFAVRFAAFS